MACSAIRSRCWPMPVTISAMCWASPRPGPRALLARRSPSARFTYGLGSSSILAALFNAIILLIAVGAIILEAAERLAAPVPVTGVTVIVVALVGVAAQWRDRAVCSAAPRNRISTCARLRAHGGRRGGEPWRRGIGRRRSCRPAGSGSIPSVSIVVALVIVIGTWRLLRQSLDMALDAVPATASTPSAVREHLARIERRVRRARSPHLADEHDRDGAHRASRDARRAIPATTTLAEIATEPVRSLRHRPRHHPGRDRSRARLPARARPRGLALTPRTAAAPARARPPPSSNRRTGRAPRNRAAGNSA